MNVHTPYIIVVDPSHILAAHTRPDSLRYWDEHGFIHKTFAFGLGQFNLAAQKAREIGSALVYGIDGSRAVHRVDTTEWFRLIDAGVAEYEFWALPCVSHVGQLVATSNGAPDLGHPEFWDTKGNQWAIEPK
jgi:hypothetical protein